MMSPIPPPCFINSRRRRCRARRLRVIKMAPVMMRRLPWLCWLALWVTTAKVTSATGVTQSNAEGGNGNSSSLSPADWSCPLEKWSLEERQNRSQVVFTAVIESCQTSESGSIDGETVEDDQEICLRYLMQQSQDQPIVGDPNLAINVRIKKVVKGLDRMWEGRRVRVEGLRDPRICPSRVRLRDTRIFLASYVNQPVSSTIHDDDETLAPVHHQPPIDSAAPIRLRLNSSLMSVSLRHLQQLRAFTKGRNCCFWYIFVLHFSVSLRPSPQHPLSSRDTSSDLSIFIFIFLVLVMGGLLNCPFHQKQAHCWDCNINKTDQWHELLSFSFSLSLVTVQGVQCPWIEESFIRSQHWQSCLFLRLIFAHNYDWI